MLGLSQKEVEIRINNSQTNAFEAKTSRSIQQILWHNIFTPINNLVLGMGIILLLFNFGTRAWVYISIIFVNILLGVVQEIRSKIALDKITHLSTPTAVVVRDGLEITIPSPDIVLDDIVKIQTGDVVPVDGVVVSGCAQTNEALLTGESNLISKKLDDEVLSGSSVISGRLFITATRVGASSMANSLTTQAKRYRVTYTRTQKDINRIIEGVFVLVFVLCCVSFFRSWSGGIPLPRAVEQIAVIVGIIPNSLFVLIGLSYSLGAIRMFRQNTLVQQLNSIESLSSLDILCFDKTGTITTGNMVFHQLETMSDNLISDVWDQLAAFSQAVTIANPTMEVVQRESKHLNIPRNTSNILVEIPFSSQYKWSGITFEPSESPIVTHRTYIMGAPEILMKHVDPAISEYQSRGFRVVVFASSADKLVESDNPKLPENLEYLGYIVLQDELRVGVKDTLKTFHESGVKTKIISGDGVLTLKAIYSLIMGKNTEQVISGAELESLDQIDFDRTIIETSIFGRITPQLKERIIDRLKAQGNQVAMVGDGVNDILSLKKADLGIAMNSGSQSTKQIADLVLLDNSLSSLIYGLTEGQKIQLGLKHIFQVQLTRSFFLSFLVIFSLIIGIRIPFGIDQTTVLSLLSTGVPSVFLTLWAAPKKLPKQALITTLWDWILPVALVLSIGAMAVVFWIAKQSELSAAVFVFSFVSILVLSGYIQKQARMWAVCAVVAFPVIIILLFKDYLEKAFRLRRLLNLPPADLLKVLAVVAVCFGVLWIAKQISQIISRTIPASGK